MEHLHANLAKNTHTLEKTPTNTNQTHLQFSDKPSRNDYRTIETFFFTKIKSMVIIG